MYIVWTKDYSRIRITDTVWAVVHVLGHGEITADHVTQVINAQLTGADEKHHVTVKQVQQVLSDVQRRGWLRNFVAIGRGVYHWF